MSEVEKVRRSEKEDEEKKRLPWWAVALIAVGGGVSCFLTIRALTYVPPDEEPPVLTLNGEAEVEVALGNEYLETGATATDERDGEIEVKVEAPEIDIWSAGEYMVKYRAVDAAGNVAEASRAVKVVAPEPVPGAVYLTFDDGPSEHTGRLLDVLKKYNVKVTFFVIGRDADELIKREYDEGHSIGLHSFSHNYAYIYQNQSTFFEDLYAIQNKVRDVTGYMSTLMRFPGGSSNTISARYDHGARIMSHLVNAVEARGFKYFDWNISSGDAGGARTADEVFNNVTSKFREGDLVVLQHDTQGFSVDAVEQIIQFGLKNGYQFKPLTTDSYGAWHGVSN